MMIAEVLAKEKLYTIEEYFKLEEKANYKSEFRNGKILPMPGGTVSHGIIIGNIFVNLSINLDEEYMVLNSEIAIFIPTYNHSVYADNFVVKGELDLYKGGKRAITNPLIIFEVASDSTEKYDRFGKFNKYKTIPTFQEYVLVDQEAPLVEVFYKKDTAWERNIYIGLEDVVQLKSVGHELKMADIYKKVKGLLDPQTILEL